ncbi:MAG: carbon-nitrogen hydrolase family protein, partial [Alphaproteobacteria bacterium]|nr:carbon-nitrogen hydrolase family protein [Alphaproteobacteria bacterium]
MKVRAACIQMTSTTDIARNIELSTALVRQAHGDGAEFITMPEVVNLCDKRPGMGAKAAFTEEKEPALKAYQALANELDIWLLAGSLVIKLADEQRMANRSFLIDPSGAVVASYDKMHMFGVDLEGGEQYRESKNYRPGERAVMADTPWGRLGMTVCYDVRFPYLY